MVNYQVTITMSQGTVESLRASNFILYAFKAIQSDSKGMPLVWYRTQDLSQNLTISWTKQLAVGTVEITNTIEAWSRMPISLGERWNFGQNPPIVSGGSSTAISIYNPTTTLQKVAIGQDIARQESTDSSPFSSFSIYGGNLLALTPIEKLLLWFSTTSIESGEPISKLLQDTLSNESNLQVNNTYSPAILIDLTGSHERRVSYDLNRGWDSNEATWGRQYPPTTNFISLLIES